jgi:hypothetical protein
LPRGKAAPEKYASHFTGQAQGFRPQSRFRRDTSRTAFSQAAGANPRRTPPRGKRCDLWMDTCQKVLLFVTVSRFRIGSLVCSLGSLLQWTKSTRISYFPARPGQEGCLWNATRSKILVSPSGMVETPRLQAKKKSAIWLQVMSQQKIVFSFMTLVGFNRLTNPPSLRRWSFSWISNRPNQKETESLITCQCSGCGKPHR